jgi:hypothetical protein
MRIITVNLTTHLTRIMTITKTIMRAMRENIITIYPVQEMWQWLP